VHSFGAFLSTKSQNCFRNQPRFHNQSKLGLEGHPGVNINIFQQMNFDKMSLGSINHSKDNLNFFRISNLCWANHYPGMPAHACNSLISNIKWIIEEVNKFWFKLCCLLWLLYSFEFKSGIYSTSKWRRGIIVDPKYCNAPAVNGFSLISYSFTTSAADFVKWYCLCCWTLEPPTNRNIHKLCHVLPTTHIHLHIVTHTISINKSSEM